MQSLLKRLTVTLLFIVVGTGGVLAVLYLQPNENKQRPDDFDRVTLTKKADSVLTLLADWDSQANAQASRLEQFMTGLQTVSPSTLDFSTGNSVPSVRDFKAQQQTWMFDEWKAVYAKRGGKPTTAEMEFMRANIAERVGEPGLPQAVEYRRWADEVADSQDPTVHLHVANVCAHNPKDGELVDVQVVLQAAEGVLALPSPRWAWLMAASMLYEHYSDRDAAKADEIAKKMMTFFQEWIEVTAEDPIAQRFIWSAIYSVWNSSNVRYVTGLMSFRDEIVRAAHRAKSIHPWLKHLLAGVYHYNISWLHRGTEFADKVPDDKWEPHGKELQLAANHFNAARLAYPKHPAPYIQMIAVAMHGHRFNFGTPLFWYQQVLKVERDNPMAVEQLMWSMQARWGGGPADLMKVSERCLDRADFDSYQPALVHAALLMLQTEEFGAQKSVWSYPPAVKVMERLYESFFKALETRQNSDKVNERLPLDTIDFRGTLAAYFAKGGRFKEAARLIDVEPMNYGYLQEQMSNLFEPGELATGALFASKSAPELIDKVYPQLRNGFRRDLSEKDYDEMLKGLTAGRDNEQQPMAKRFYLHALVLAQRARAFDQGDWVPLTFDNDAAGWEPFADEWEILDEKSLKVKTAPAFIESISRFPLPYVVSFEIEPPVTPRMYPPGVTIGERDVSALDGAFKRTRHFFLEGHGFAVLNHDRQTGAILTPMPQQPRHVVRVKAWPHWYCFEVDGIEGINRLDPLFEPATKLSFGSPVIPSYVAAAESFPSTLVLSNIRIRKLSQPQPPALPKLSEDDPNHETLLKYFEQAIQFDSDDVHARFTLTNLRFDQAKPQESLQQFLQVYRQQPGLMMIGLGAKIGRCYFELGDYREASEWFERQYSVITDHPSIRIEFAYFLAACPDGKYRNGQRALQMAETGLKWTSADLRWQALHSRAHALAEVGRFSDALRDLEESESLAPSSKKTRFPALKQMLLNRTPLRLNATN